MGRVVMMRRFGVNEKIDRRTMQQEEQGESMTAKEYLNQFRRMQERIREMNLSIQRIEDQLDVKGMSYDGMPGGGTGTDRTAELVSKMCDIKMQREVVKQSAQLFCVEIENVIDKVRDYDESRLLYDRYVLGKDFETIAEDLHVSYRQATRIHGSALLSVGKIMENYEICPTMS